MATPVVVKEFFAKFLILVQNAAGINISPIAEDDGTLRNAPIGSSDGGTTLENIKTETTGEQDVVFHGKDSEGNIDAVRTNASKELIVDITGLIPIARKVLGQSAPGATTETVLYTVPASTAAEVTMISVANRNSSTAFTFRIGLSVGGGALATTDYIVYDISLPAGNAYVHAAPIYLAATDEIRIEASTDQASFNVTGKEYTA